jgi:hypothetical protein
LSLGTNDIVRYGVNSPLAFGLMDATRFVELAERLSGSAGLEEFDGLEVMPVKRRRALPLNVVQLGSVNTSFQRDSQESPASIDFPWSRSPTMQTRTCCSTAHSSDA